MHALVQRVQAVLLTDGKPCPVTDLFGVRGRQQLTWLGLLEQWEATIEARLRLIDELARELRLLGADQHRPRRWR